MNNSEICVCCGEPAPEGRQVCHRCEDSVLKAGTDLVRKSDVLKIVCGMDVSLREQNKAILAIEALGGIE